MADGITCVPQVGSLEPGHIQHRTAPGLFSALQPSGTKTLSPAPITDTLNRH